MLNQKTKMTAASIRYLLAVRELSKDSGDTKSNEIAKRLGITKPSVHAMLNKICDKGLATKERYGVVRLTALGESLAGNYSRQYALMYSKIEHFLQLTPEGYCNVVYAILSQLDPSEWTTEE